MNNDLKKVKNNTLIFMVLALICIITAFVANTLLLLPGLLFCSLTYINVTKWINLRKPDEVLEMQKKAKDDHMRTVSSVYATVPIKKREQLAFRVDGISKEDTQQRIKHFVDAVKEGKSSTKLYDGWSDKNILKKYSEGERIYEISINGYSEIELIPDPDNEFDSNALKVVHDKMGQIGYVAAADCTRVKDFMEKKYDSEWKLLGGKYKYIEYDDKKGAKVVRTSTDTYGVEIILVEFL